MKRFLLWFCITPLGLISCQQEDNTLPNNPNITMTTTEQALVGKWYWDSTRVYNAGDLTDTITLLEYCTGIFGVDTVCTMDFKTSLYGGITSNPQRYDCITKNGINNPVTLYWSVLTTNNIQPLEMLVGPSCGLGEGGYIRVLTSTQLEISTWGGTVAQGQRHYFHKL